MSNEQQKETKMELASEYDASQIQVLKGLDAVRKRPGMYIGSNPKVRDAIRNAVFDFLGRTGAAASNK